MPFPSDSVGPLDVDVKPFPNVLFSGDYQMSVNGDAMIRYNNYDGTNLKVQYIKGGNPPATLDLPQVPTDNLPEIHKAAADAVSAA